MQVTSKRREKSPDLYHGRYLEFLSPAERRDAGRRQRRQLRKRGRRVAEDALEEFLTDRRDDYPCLD